MLSRCCQDSGRDVSGSCRRFRRGLEVRTQVQAAVAAYHVRKASSRKTRSVRRDVRWLPHVSRDAEARFFRVDRARSAHGRRSRTFDLSDDAGGVGRAGLRQPGSRQLECAPNRSSRGPNFGSRDNAGDAPNQRAGDRLCVPCAPLFPNRAFELRAPKRSCIARSFFVRR